MFLGGVFYYNLFKWTFDEKLKQDVLDLVKVHAVTLLEGLQRSPDVLTMAEYDVMQQLSKDDRVAGVLYLNKGGYVRWHKEARFINMAFEDYLKTVGTDGIPTDAIAAAHETKSPKVRLVPKQPFYEIAIPLSVKGSAIGIVDLMVSRAGAANLISAAMAKYVFGAVGVLILLGIPLYVFIHHFVVGPLANLRDAVDSISTKTFEMRFARRADEIGEAAAAIENFLHKIKSELDTIAMRSQMRQEAEQHWWQSILATVIPPGCKVIVVDEDNNVLYANFSLNQPAPDQKLHLLDVVDAQQQELLRLISDALDKPNQVVEGDTAFKGESFHLKVVHLEESAELRRTLMLFEPR